ncbi:hypothetical protein ACFLYD_02140 [Chloroflexota bacterium]
MIDALQVVKYSLRGLWEDLLLLVVLNLLWGLAAVLPIIPWLVLPTGDLMWLLAMSFLLLWPLPIISGALCYVTNQVSRGKAVTWGSFGTGLRRYWVKSLVVALINLVVLILLVTNFRFYGAVLQGLWTNVALIAWSILGAYWLLVQIFWFPMILELESEKVLLALRNALAMVLITPGFTLTLAVIFVLLAVLCIALTVPVLLLMASLFLLMANHATRSRLAFVQKEAYQPGIDQD